MKAKSTLRHFLALAGCSVMAVSSASAAGPYYWDGNDATSGFGTAGGTWADPTTGTATSGWSTDSTGLTSINGNSVSTTTTDSLNFGTNTAGFGLATGTINVSGTVNSGNMTFGTQSGVITFSGGTINFANSVIISGNGIYEIGSVITGASTALTRAGVNGTLKLTNTNNSYTGRTDVIGVIEATSLADGGSNSSIGASSNAVGSLVFSDSSNRNGTLTYTGSSNASTDRLFMLNGGGNVTIANNGSGTLAFSNTGSLAYGSSAAGQTRILTLGGTYTGGQNTFNPLIEDNGTNATSFNKTGAGTWVLANNSNSYTGQTNIQVGTLVIGSIADYGTASAIGKGTAGTAIILGNGNSTGTLIYTGGTQGTNRLIQVGNNSLATGGATILNNGTGTLTFTGSVFNPTYGNGNTLTRTLTLGGTNNGIIQGTIQDSSATTKNGVTKTGSGTWTLNGTNSYTQATVIQEGNLVAGSNSLSLTNGAFGNASSDINLGVAGGNSNAGLLIGGAFTVGRNIRLLTSNTTDAGTRVLTIGGNTADNSEFSGNIFLGTNSQAGRGVTLTAASGGQVTFSGVIQNPTSMDATSYTVTKAGAGTVVLSNSNTYTGGTTITAGTLTITGTTQATNSITFTGGSLGLDTGVTVTASNAAVDLTNGTIKVTGSTGNPSYTLLTAASITGTPVLTAPVPGYSLQVVGNDLLLVQSGGGPGPLDHFAISAIGSPQTVGTPITGITLTAQDASNQTVTGFTGTVTFGGTGGFSGTSATFSSGVLSGVSVTPTLSGSNLTLTVTDGVSGKTGSTTIATIQSQYEAWAGGAAFSADANGDGVSNGLAWLLGASSPTSAVTLPTVTQSGGNLTMNFTCLNAASRGAAVLNVQHSSDLGISDAWTTVAVPETSGGPTSGVTFTVTPGSPNNTVTATISNSEAASGKLFGRLKAVNP